MFLETAANVCLVILLSLADAQWQNERIVEYPLQTICIKTGNSVDIPCWYQNPGNNKVHRTFWYKEWVNGDEDPKDLAEDPEYRNRVEYLGDKNHNCTFRIKQLKRKDSVKYQFRFITEGNERYAGYPGVTLSVTDTQVAAKLELDFALELTCNTGCPHGNVMYTWYKNGDLLQGEYLDNIYIHYKEDMKNYSCAFQERKESSLLKSIYIHYTMIVNPLGEIVEGNSVILICRSNTWASENSYKWYKKNGTHTHEMKSSKTLIIKDIKPEHNGYYFCELWPKKSTEVYVNVQYAPKDISVIASPSLKPKERDSVTLTCGAKANPEVERYTWFKKNGEEITELGSGNKYTITSITSKNIGQYYCSGENRHGVNNSAYLFLNVQYAPKNISVIASPSLNLKEHDSVTLTCSSDANPPAKSYRWFKDEILISPGASGQNYTINNIKFEHNGRYNCNAMNDIGSHSSPAVFIFVEDAQWQNERIVEYPLQSICIKTGNSVDIPCWYQNPANNKVNRTFWYKEWVNGDEDPKDLAEDPEYHNRVEYLGDKNHNCTFRIKQLKRKDSVKYQFRFITEGNERYTGYPGVTLTVTDTQVAAKQELDFALALTCNAGCPHGNVMYTWYKNGDLLQGEYLDNIYIHYKEDMKNYSCAFQDRKESSSLKSIYVHYTMIVNPLGEIVEGNSVILICRSNTWASENSYKWYKKNGTHTHEMKSSKMLIITDIKPEHSGHYFCELWAKKSTEVYVNVQYAPKNISVIASPSLNLKERDSVTLTCSSDANPPAKSYRWFKKNGEEIIEFGSGNKYTITSITSKDSGQYYCSGENRHGANNSTYLFLNVQYAPRELSVSVSPTGGIMMGDSVTLTCSSDANPPAKSYRWFKDEILISPGVSGQNYTINNIKFEHNGRYNCNAMNDIGSHSSPAVFIFVDRETAAIIGMTVGIAAVVVLVVVMTLVCKISKHSPCKKDTRRDTQYQDTANTLYANISGMAPKVIEIQEEPLYSTVQDKSRDREQVQHMSIYEPCDPNEVQYSTVQFPLSNVTSRTPVQMLTDASVIYSTVSKP